MDADDWIEPDAVEKAMELAEIYDADIVSWNFWYNYKDKQIKRTLIEPELIIRTNEELDVLQNDVLGYYYDEVVKRAGIDEV